MNILIGTVEASARSRSIADGWNSQDRHSPAQLRALVGEFLDATRTLSDEEIVAVADIHPHVLRKWRMSLLIRVRRHNQERLLDHLRRGRSGGA